MNYNGKELITENEIEAVAEILCSMEKARIMDETYQKYGVRHQFQNPLTSRGAILPITKKKMKSQPAGYKVRVILKPFIA